VQQASSNWKQLQQDQQHLDMELHAAGQQQQRRQQQQAQRQQQ
jgi:hypothetical protein